MMRRHVFTLSLIALTALFAFGQLAPSDAYAKSRKARKAKQEKSKNKEEKKEQDSWDVTNPPGEWNTISIDTQETTWSEIDVSPDGKTVLFDMLGDIYTMPIEGGDATALTNGIEWNFQPRYSPDGKQIAFVSDRGGADNIWVMNSDGSEPRAVSEEKEHLVHNPNWSPDGDYIIGKKGFTSTRSIPAGEIWLFHAGGGGGLQITERPLGKRDQKTMAEPAFSPDGKYIYYSQDITPGQRWAYNKDSTGQIFVIKRLDRERGETEVFVSGPGGAIRPTPSPDGKHLAFVKRLPGLQSALYLKDLESGKEWPIYDKYERDLQETNGSQGNATAFGWTPDSKNIVFWSAGKIRKIDVSTRNVDVIPVRVQVEKKVQPALRFAVDVAPAQFPVRVLRWAQKSPDGTKVVFQALGHLYIKDMETGTQSKLTSQDDHFEFYPSFSPDGRSIVYTTWDDQELGSVRVISTEGGPSRAITNQPGHFLQPRYSPDGNWITYRKLTGGYLLSPLWSVEPGIWVASSKGSDHRRVSKIGVNPHFSGSSDRVFYSRGEGDQYLMLESVNLDGLEKRSHVKASKATEMTASPDGRWVAFVTDFNAYVAPFTSTGKVIDLSSSTKSIPVRQVSKRAGEFLNWSADSRALTWAHGPVLYSRSLNEAFSFLAGAPEELPEPVETGLDLGFKTETSLPEGQVALVGARVVTMRGARDGQEEIIEDGVVLIDGNRIAAVGGRDTVIPATAKTIDLAGKTIIPGLVDAHAHGAMSRNEITPQQNWMQFSNLAFGVTAIHDPSNDTSSIFAVGELQKAGLTVAPRIYSTGTILYGAHAPGYTAKIDGFEDAKFHVQRLKDMGAISVKSYQQPRRDQRQQIVQAGRDLGIMVVPEGGAKFQHNMSEIVDGHTGLEHAIPLVRAYDDVTQFWSQTDVGYTPTFGVAYGGLSGEVYWYDRTEVWKNERLMRYAPRYVIEPRSIRRPTAPDEHYNHIEVAKYAKVLRDAGVSVQIGAHGQREGLAAHWEMWMMNQGGFTPWEAIRGATIDGAWYVGLDHELGSIEVGKLADLAIIEGNPLENLRQSEFVTHTVLGGRIYETETMNQVWPSKIEREPFFFELEGGDTIHPATTQWLEELQHNHGWVH